MQKKNLNPKQQFPVIRKTSISFPEQHIAGLATGATGISPNTQCDIMTRICSPSFNGDDVD